MKFHEACSEDHDDWKDLAEEKSGDKSGAHQSTAKNKDIRWFKKLK